MEALKGVSEKVMKLILLGAPGAGKGSQGKILAEHYNILTLCSGDILRSRVKEKAGALGFAESMNGGQLVSDEYVMNLVMDELKKPKYENGYILDGVPRTVEQADMLERNGIKVDAVLYIDASDEVVKRRILNRRVCSCCGALHCGADLLKCGQCGGNLEKRADDTAEVIQERLNVYREKTEPLVGYYSERGLLKKFDGNQEKEKVAELMFDVLERL
ncbi:MAG: nucleoside monophosphate kinase [Oscillospiraceae bacterium]|jgi:adenylate kinase|nr:nucleoside monophosphate kinase [Oscillospiraceae bacterium]